VHEIAQKAQPSCRVVYVDLEDVAVAHSQLLLEGNPLATIVEADITRPGRVLRHQDTVGLLDFDEPLGVLALTVGHYVDDDEVLGVFEQYRDALVPGGMLAISHATGDFERVKAHDLIATAIQAGGDGLHARSRAQIRQLFGDFEMVEPGLVPPSSWRPDSLPPVTVAPEDDGMWAGVGIKRGAGDLA
jgi:hypothetical protein